MSMSYERKPVGKKRGGGVYIAVALCCAAVCLAAWSSVVVRGGKSGEVTAEPETEQSYSTTVYTSTTAPSATETGQTVPTQPVVEFVSSEAPAVTEEAEPDEPEAVEVSVQPAAHIMPLINGELIKGYSAGALVYCSTMGDWRVHEGVDVACEEGADLYCACSGRVYAMYEDALYGNTAIVEHEDGSMLYYCGLEDFSRLSQGMELKTGDLMGQVGVVPCEADDGPHIHLAYMQDGGYTEPLEALGIK